MKLRHRIRHALSKPPRVIVWKVANRTLRQARRFQYWSWLRRRLQHRLRAFPVEELRARLTSAPQLLDPARMDVAARIIRDRFPEEASALIAEADRIVALEFSYLGWTRRYEALPLPWTSDWRTGRVWGPAYYADYDYSEPHRPSDVKSCWEPSRFHFAVRLGQAYRLTGDDRYQQHFFALLRDWHAVNPLAQSVNWTSPLEVAIRGVNLAAALTLFAGADESELRLLVELLAEHGAFLIRNVEYTDVRGNHYTGNLLGLLTLGLLLEPLVPEAAKWRQYAEERIPTEILLQFLADGVNFEKSIPYHRFVTEMFVLAGLLLARAGRPLARGASERLRSAVAFTAAYIRPDGRAPVVGDNDDARALPLTALPPADHQHLVCTSALLLNSLVPIAASHRAWTEAVWLSGGLVTPEESDVPASASYSAGGFYIARHGPHYLLMDAGSVGLQSGGCHGHHDMLSVELVLDGTPILVDAGAPAYTGDVEAKNTFRRTAAHNTVRIDGVEQGSFDPSRLWHLGAEALPRDARFTTNAAGTIIEAAHAGYERLSRSVVHRRRVALTDSGRFDGMDSFSGEGEHELELYFHFDPDVSVALGNFDARITAGGRVWRFVWSPRDVHGELLAGEVSPSYGVRRAASVLIFRRRGAVPWDFHYSIETT